MNTTAIKSTTLLDSYWRGDGTLLRNLIIAIIGSLVLWLSAKVQIPFYPVPITMQTFMIMVIGLSCGMRLGMLTVFLYLLEGAMGLPVFAGTPEKGIGLAYMVGPTGGYLFGFLAAAGVVGYLAEKGWSQSLFKTFAAMFIGTVIIYAFGLYWLGHTFGWDKPILEWGLTPFIPGDIFKMVLAPVLMAFAWKNSESK